MASVVMVVSGANVWTMKNAKPHPTGFAGNAPWLLGSPPYFWRALHRKSTLDAACHRRRQPHDGSAELFGRCNS